MAYEPKEGQGALFKNLDKDEETHADYKGDILINGQSYWLNAWLKKSKNGVTYMSVFAKPKQKNMGQALKQVREQSKPSRPVHEDEEPPF